MGVERDVIWQVRDGRNIDFWSDWWVTEEPLGLQQDIAIPEELYHAKVSDFILPNRLGILANSRLVFQRGS